MENSWGERASSLGGPVFVLLLAVAGFFGGEPPAADAPPNEVTTYLADHQSGLEAGVWLLGLGSVSLIWWLGSLWRRMARAEGGAPRLAVVSLTGVAVAGPLALTSSVLWAATAAGLRDAGATAPILYRVGAMLLGAEGFGLAAHLLATNLLAVRTRMLPRWLVIPGLLAALAFLVTAVLSAVEVDVNSSLGLAAFGLWCAWILGVSWCMWQEKAAAPDVPSRAG